MTSGYLEFWFIRVAHFTADSGNISSPTYSATLLLDVQESEKNWSACTLLSRRVLTLSPLHRQLPGSVRSIVQEFLQATFADSLWLDAGKFVEMLHYMNWGCSRYHNAPNFICKCYITLKKVIYYRAATNYCFCSQLFLSFLRWRSPGFGLLFSTSREWKRTETVQIWEAHAGEFILFDCTNKVTDYEDSCW